MAGLYMALPESKLSARARAVLEAGAYIDDGLLVDLHEIGEVVEDPEAYFGYPA